ncbi:MAG: S9 family peptidase [Planctomycetales bacterium]|nr:S9 family peptidase [Planctomycetales bacterium]
MAKSTARRRRITPEDLQQFISVADPQISPDGSRVLLTRSHVGEKNQTVSNLWIVEADGSVRPFSSGDNDRHGRWSPDGSRVGFTSSRDKRRPQIYVLEANGGEARAVTDFPEGSIGSWAWSPDGRMLAVSFRQTDAGRTEAAEAEREENGSSTPPWEIDELFYRLDGDGYFGSARFRLHLVDTETGTQRMVFGRGTNPSFSFDWSPDSSELLVATNVSREPLLTPWKDELFRISAKTGKARRISGVPDGWKSAARFSPDGQRVLFAGREGRETWGVRNTHLFSCRLDGSDLQNLTGHTDFCLSSTVISDTAEATFGAHYDFTADGQQVLMCFGWHGASVIATVPLAGGRVRLLTSGPTSTVMGNLSDDGRRIAVCTSDATTLPEVGLAEIRGGRQLQDLAPKPLTNFNGPLLKQLELSKPTEKWITAEDGTRVHAWVMQPPGRTSRSRRRCPGVLQVHGGPHALYGTTFFHEFQVLAAAGHVVVFSNPRGSKGYGEEHCTAIQGKWGAADWTDVQAVASFMEQHPAIDPQRIGIMGGSYGGYMTNWAITHTDRFAAAITDRCVANLVSMAGSSDYPLVPGEYWPGNPWDDNQEIWQQSPIRAIRNVTTPTLVIHSEGDLRCNVEQGEQVFAALKMLGVPTRFVRYPRETSHGMSRCGPPDLRIHRLGEILAWWSKYL